MIDRDQTAMSTIDRPVEAIVRHLHADDEVIRCAAAKALGAFGDPTASPALVDGLLDPDPDVRTDVMEALVACARADDAEAIRKSLEGDPVKEVKIFAIQALARLEDRAARPLIRRLAKDRAEDAVTWEDDAGMWDDWLDVQIAAIEALGRMQASEAINTLLEARNDEMGQELDDVILPALARIEDGGISALLSLLRDRDARVRERAIKAMGKARPDTLRPMRALLLGDRSPAIRKLAIPTLDPTSTAATDLTLHDRDAGVRRAALQAFADKRLDLVKSALRDEACSVRAVALKAIAEDEGHAGLPDLADNVQAWMFSAELVLASVATAVVPKLIGERATAPLCRLAEETERPIELRLAAIDALGRQSGSVPIETLQRCVIDPTSQIRAAALASLAVLANKDAADAQQTAETVLAAAIRGDLGGDAKAHPPLEAAESDLGASKTEGGQGRVSITPDGDIVTAETEDDTVIDGHFPTSTLDAIQTIAALPAHDNQLGQLSAGARTPARRRVPLDGPADIAADIRRIAMAMAADCRGELIGEALIDALSDGEPTVRAAAFRALAQRSASGSVSDRDEIRAALKDPDAAIRHDAARILSAKTDDCTNDQLAALIDDEDAMVRTTAVAALGRHDHGIALKALEDSSSAVRRAAMTSILDRDAADALTDGLRVCLAQGHADTLMAGQRQNPRMRDHLLAFVRDGRPSRTETLTALEALASL